jgi:ATP-binding cassette subfamily B (MDR/TAP) protein 1
MEARLHRDEYLPAIFLITEGCIVLGAPVRVRAVSADLTTLKPQTFLPNSKLSDEPLLRSWDTLAQDALSSIKTIHAVGAHQKLIGRYDVYVAKAQSSPCYCISTMQHLGV